MDQDRIALRLYRAHRSSLLNYAARLSGDRVEAEDIVQDAWLLFDRRADPIEVREPLGYMKRIIRNLVFARARSRIREGSVAAADLASGGHDIADDRPLAETELIARQAMEIVMQAIDAMPDRQRTAIRMYHLEGTKLRDIAARLGLSVSYTHFLIVEGIKICNQRRRQGS